MNKLSSGASIVGGPPGFPPSKRGTVEEGRTALRRFRRSLWSVTALAIWAAAAVAAEPAAQEPPPAPTLLTVEAKLPGGFGEVVSIDQQARSIRLRVPQVAGWPVWWHVRVDGIEPGESIRLAVEGAKYPAKWAVWSKDGQRWQFTAAATKSRKKTEAVEYEQRVDAPSAHFAWYVPFGSAEAEKTVADAVKRCPEARRFVLCRSEAGRDVLGVSIGADERDPNRPAVWVHARQHAWEVGGSWTAAGLVAWLTGDEEQARALRKRAEVIVVPIMDVDNVARGTGGKDQKPHDHNRDWSDEPHWASVRAATARIKALDETGRMHLFLDLHDPGWGGGFEFWVTGIGKCTPLRQERTACWMEVVKAELAGSERTWSIAKQLKEPGYIGGKPSSGNWVRANTRDVVVAGVFEIPVAPPKAFKGDPPLPHLELGRQLGRAISRFLNR